MNIQDVVAKATINFPVPLIQEEVETLFHYFRQQANFVTRYTTSTTKDFGNLFEPATMEENPVIRQVKISGDILDPQSNETQHFTCPNGHIEEQKPYFSALKFDIVAGWKDLDEYRLPTRTLWDETRKLVDCYFEARSKAAEREYGEQIYDVMVAGAELARKG